MWRSTRRYSSGIGSAAVGVGEAVWSIDISSIILTMSITRVWKSRAKFARPPIMLDMRISRETALSRYCHTASGAQPQSRRRPAAGLSADPAGLFDQTLVLDETPEILLVQPHSRQRLDGALQLQQGEGGRHQLENDWSILDLAAQAADCGGEDPPVIGRHRYAENQTIARQGRPPEIAPRLLDQPRLVEQLIAFEDELLVPRSGEGETQPLYAQSPFRLTRCLPRPCAETRFERRERRRPPGAPVLPREIAVPALPRRLACAARPHFADQCEISHRQRAPRPRVFDAVAVTEGVELLDIAQFLARLPLDPGTQPYFEGAMLDLQGAGRQCLDRVAADAHRQHARLIDRRRHDHRAQSDRQRGPAAALMRHQQGGAGAGPLHPSGTPCCTRRSLPYARFCRLRATCLSRKRDRASASNRRQNSRIMRIHSRLSPSEFPVCLLGNFPDK